MDNFTSFFKRSFWLLVSSVLCMQVQAQTVINPTSTAACGSYTVNPGVPGNAYRASDAGGWTWTFNTAGCTNKAWGFDYSSGINYDYDNSTTNSINTLSASETNLLQGKLVLTGTTSLQYMNTSGNWVTGTGIGVRATFKFTDLSNNPIPVKHNGTIIYRPTTSDFKVNMLIEVNADDLTNPMWHPQTTSLSGWQPGRHLFNTVTNHYAYYAETHLYFYYYDLTDFNFVGNGFTTPPSGVTVTKNPTAGGIERIGKYGNTGVYYTIANVNNPSCLAFGFDVATSMGLSCDGNATTWLTKDGDILPFHSQNLGAGQFQWRGYTTIRHMNTSGSWVNSNVRVIIQAYFYQSNGTTTTPITWEKGMVYAPVPQGSSIQVRLLARMYTNDLSAPAWNGTDYTNASWTAFLTAFDALRTDPADENEAFTRVVPQFFETGTYSAAPTGASATNTTICTGGSSVLSHTGGGLGTGASWVWRTGSCTGTVVPGGASPTVSPTSTTTYYVSAEGNCNKTTCQSVTVTVVTDPSTPTGTKSPNVATVCEGQALSVASLSSSGGTGTCSYEYNFHNGTSWTGWTATSSYTAVAGTNQLQIRRTCNGSGCGNSGELTLSWTVAANPTPPTAANKSPNVGAVCVGQALSVSSPTGGSSGVSGCSFEYRFQRGATTVQDWSASSSYTTTAADAGNTINVQIRRAGCTGSGCTATSSASSTLASWTVAADPTPPTSVTKSPNVAWVCVGQALSVSSPTGGSSGVSGCSFEYLFQRGGSTVQNWSASSSYITAAADVGNTINVQVRRAGCTGSGCTATSAVSSTLASWNVAADPSVSIEPVAETICSGDSYTMSTTISGGTGLGYQWQYSTDEISWFDVTTNAPATGFSYSGNNTASLTISTTAATPASVNYYFRCMITSGAGCNPNPLYTASAAVAISVATINPGFKTWVGAAQDNDWHNPINWDCGGIPVITSNVIIPANSTPAGYFPIIFTGNTGLCETIRVEGPPSTVRVQPGGFLHVNSP